jgi:multiple sugar transport system permease protein
LLLLAGLKAIDNEQLEAAEVDGASAVQRFRHVTLPGLRYVLIVVLLLSFISTFNQFGLIFLMTGGGPGGATRLYSILAYEKAIGSLQYGPGSAIALSVAPLMALLIYFLARFLRRDDRAARSGERGIGTAVWGAVGRAASWLLDMIFLPIDLFVKGVERLFNAITRTVTGVTDQQVFTIEQREKIQMSLRMLALVPIMIFVLFPFYWVFVTSFKTTPQISARTSIFWPDPVTFEQFRSLLQDTPFLVWFGNSILVGVVSTAISVVFAALAAALIVRAGVECDAVAKRHRQCAGAGDAGAGVRVDAGRAGLRPCRPGAQVQRAERCALGQRQPRRAQPNCGGNR